MKPPSPWASRETKRSCFVSLHVHTVDLDGIARAVHRGVFRAGFAPVLVAERSAATSLSDTVVGELARADCVLADVTDSSPHTFFELGLAQAMGKAVLLLVRSEDPVLRLAEARPFAIIAYEQSPRGLIELTARIQRSLEDLLRAPEAASSPCVPQLARRFAVEWDELERDQAEQLCRDLLARMGFRQIEWSRDHRGIDLTAELPRRDPDGLPYREIWLVAMGRHVSTQAVVAAFRKDPARLLQDLARRDESDALQRSVEATITLLVIPLHEEAKELERLQRRLARYFARARAYRHDSMRVRLWDRPYLTSLVQQFPELAFKYFGPLGRSAKLRRDGRGNRESAVELEEKLAVLQTELTAERNRRIRLEADAIWKEISFTALHQMVNPVFAIETFLDPLERRIREGRADEARQVVANIRTAVEKAKSIIEQFKGLARAQRIDARPLLLLPLLEESCGSVRGLGLACTIKCPADLRVVADPDRLGECFREIVANGADAGDPEARHIAIEASPVGAVIPDGLDSEHRYVLVRINDQGTGVVVGDKRRVSEIRFANGDRRHEVGLSLARRIVEGHGGMMLEAGAPAAGNELDIYLRIASGGGESAAVLAQPARIQNGA